MKDQIDNKEINHLDQSPSRVVGEVEDDPSCAHDAVFGEISEDGPKYRNVGWIGTSALMIKTQIGLGVLSIPTAFDTLGMIPGVTCLLVIAIITTWSNYIVGTFKLRHRAVYGIDDAGGLMFGRLGREFFATAFCLYWIFVAGSGMLGVSIGLNAVSTHAACTAIFIAVAAIVGFSLASIQTLAKITWLAWVGATCIIISILTVTVAVGVQDRPADAPRDGVYVSDYKLVQHPSFTSAASALSSLVFAYSGTPAFFSIVSEMREPHHYNRSMVICQSVMTAIYISIGIVVYYFCGSYVSSPALGSAGPTMKKVAYGFALPALIVTTCIVIHLPGKYLFIRMLRGSKHLSKNTAKHWIIWFSCTGGVTLAAYIIASAIPVFGGLVSLIGALLGTVMSVQPMGCMWLYDNWHKGRAALSARWALMVCWSALVVAAGTFLMVAGTYGSVVGIIESYQESGGSAAWSCADNSNTVCPAGGCGQAASGGH